MKNKIIAKQVTETLNAMSKQERKELMAKIIEIATPEQQQEMLNKLKKMLENQATSS